jgi:hypothetical protein
MRFNELINEAEARIQHAEDLVFFQGSAGAKRALDSLSSMGTGGHTNATIKWDGSPAVIFGRDENGEFILTDKSGFGAKGYDGKSKSADDLEQMFLNRSGGKNRDKPGYVAFAGRMKALFPIMEKAVPIEHRGYFKGDMLYFDTPTNNKGVLQFTPNTVTYTVQADSDIGKKILASSAGVVIHRVVDADGTEAPLKDYDIFQGNKLLVLPPVVAQTAPEVNLDKLNNLKSIVAKNGPAIDSLLDQSTLKQMQVSDFANILYNYTNTKVDSSLKNLGKDFVQWLTSNPKISKNKQQKIIEYIKQHMKAFQAMWQTVSGIMEVKDDIITQMESKQTDIKASIAGKPGGEGYVLANPGGDIKLVNRSEFSKANRAIKRESNEMKASDFDSDFADMKKGFDPADSDDADMDKEFKQTPMITQVGKILDSRGNPNPVTELTSDSGKKYKANVGHAQALKMMLTTDAVKPNIKREFTLDIQQDELLGQMTSAKSQKEMVEIFKDRYMKDGGNTERRSNYA